MLATIINALSTERFSLTVEKTTQIEIETLFNRNGIAHIKEYHLDKNNIPDFFIDGIAIEVKIKGNAKQIYRQCERYSKFKEVKIIILVTNRSMGFPKEINGKPCYIINMGRAWL